jgi:KUP system potassium uptake protein
VSSHTQLNKVSAAGVLIAFGIIYGDIGTSPLYVFNAITKGLTISEALIVGSLSCILWTITLQTTIKYVWKVLKVKGGLLLYTRW